MTRYGGLVKVSPKTFMRYMNNLIIKDEDGEHYLDLWEQDDIGNFYVPRFCGVGYDPEDGEKGRKAFVGCSGIALRPHQEEPVDITVRAILGRGGGVLVAPAGSGKTVMALEVARRIGVSTCVLVHKRFLVDQWVDRINTFLPQAKVGTWTTKERSDGYDNDIVVALVQSQTMGIRQAPPEVYQSFGLLITDEVHRFSAKTWQSVIKRFPARYRLGVTATPSRRDGLEKVFRYHTGPIVHEVHTERPITSVIGVPTGIRIDPSVIRGYGKRPVNTAKMDNLLASNKARTQRIVKDVKDALSAGRKILVLSSRVSLLKTLRVHLAPYAEARGKTVGRYAAGLSREEQEKVEKKDVILATYQLAKEGLDIPALDTLFLVTPRVSIEQAVGRIQRFYAGKKPPLVIDYVDQIPVCVGYWRARQKQYARIGARVLARA